MASITISQLPQAEVRSMIRENPDDTYLILARYIEGFLTAGQAKRSAIVKIICPSQPYTFEAVARLCNNGVSIGVWDDGLSVLADADFTPGYDAYELKVGIMYRVTIEEV